MSTLAAAVRAEWVKQRTMPSTGWLCLGAAAVTIAISVLLVATTHASAAGDPNAARLDPTKLALTGVLLGQAIVAVIGVLTVGEEYGTGMIRLSVAAVPRRSQLLAAKAVVVTGLVTVVAVVAVAGCLVAGRLLLPVAGIGPAHGYRLVSIADGATLRAAAGGVLYLVLIGLLTVGLTTAIRDTAVSIGVALGLLYLPLLLIQAVADPLRRHLEQIAPMTAGMAVLATNNLNGQPLTPWAGIGVLAAWAAGALLLGGVMLRYRNV
jgi:ABC-2 type transport system permease protein